MDSSIMLSFFFYSSEAEHEYKLTQRALKSKDSVDQKGEYLEKN